MKLSPRQKSEIGFLAKVFVKDGYMPSQEEMEEYIKVTVHGGGAHGEGKLSNNKLLGAKHHLDMMVKMWREDLTAGMLSVKELKSDFDHPYGTALVDSIIKSVTPEYRKKILAKGYRTVLSFTNFPELMN